MAFTNLALAVYPVGSLYFSSTSTSPAESFGGTWTQLNDGKFLRPSDSFGETGGSDTHSHTFNLAAALDSSLAKLTWKYSRSKLWYPNWAMSMSAAGYDITDEPHYSSTDVFGEIHSASTVPTYRTVYCWYRVA